MTEARLVRLILDTFTEPFLSSLVAVASQMLFQNQNQVRELV